MFSEDLSAFFDAEDFALDATWKPCRGDPVPGAVIFDAPGEIVIDGVASNDYSALYRVSQWPNVREGDLMVISGLTYCVRQTLPIDDGALARALLSRRLS